MRTVSVATSQQLTAALKAALPDDLILLTAMSYQGPFRLNRSGREGHPIVIMAKEHAVIAGGDNAFTLVSSSWIEFEHITFTVAKERGLSTGGCHHITLRGCLAVDNGIHGFFFGNTNDVSLVDCEALRTRDQHGLYFSNNGDGLTIVGGRYCYNAHAGIQTNGPGKTRRIRINGAVLTGNGVGKAGAALNLLETDDVEVVGVTIEDNLFGALNMNGTKAVIERSTVKMPAGAHGNCLNVGNGSDCRCEDLTVQMGREGEPWYIAKNSRFSENGTTVLPVATEVK